MKKLPPVILASQSPQRKMIMDALGVPYSIVPANVDEEAIRHEDMKVMAENLARAKAEKVAKDHPNTIVIAADCFVICKGKELQKPQDREEAKDMLRLISNETFEVLTGFCYIDQSNNIDVSETVVISTTFREMTENEIHEYVIKYPVTTWSAAFSPAYPYGMTVVDRINGSLNGFIYGIPVELVVKYLRESGYDVCP